MFSTVSTLTLIAAGFIAFKTIYEYDLQFIAIFPDNLSSLLHRLNEVKCYPWLAARYHHFIFEIARCNRTRSILIVHSHALFVSRMIFQLFLVNYNLKKINGIKLHSLSCVWILFFLFSFLLSKFLQFSFTPFLLTCTIAFFKTKWL